MPLEISPTIFRAYDIRGVVDRDLDETVYERLGQATGTFFDRQGRRTIAVGRDARLSSPRFAAAFIAGLRQVGIDVTDIGPVPTSVMYFAVEHLAVDGGAIISASHNPPEYNGLKLRKSQAPYGSEPFTADDFQQVAQLALSKDFSVGNGALHSADVSDAYIASVVSLLRIDTPHPARIVLDGGNGVAGPIGLRTLRALGFDVVPLYIEPDGRFPNHHPDPLKAENLNDLIRTVREHNADMGIALDGDGDRLGVVDGNGTIVWADRYLIVLARYLLAQRKGAVVFDVKCSTVLRDAISVFGGTPVMWKTGYSSISAKMRELDAVLGGELSGHTFSTYPKHYYDDGTFAGAHLLYALHSLGQTLAEALEPYPELPSLDEGRIPFAEATKFQVIEYVQQQFAGRFPMTTIDGVRIDFGDGWGLVRASNTEPAITTRFEAVTDERVHEIRKMMMDVVQEFQGGVRE